MQKNFDHILYGTHSRAKWSSGCRLQNLAPRRQFLWNLNCEYLRKERSCGTKTFTANRYYNVCYAQSIVFMFHELLRFIITKQIFLHWRRGGATQCLEGQLKSRPRSKEKLFFMNPLSFLSIRMCSFYVLFLQNIFVIPKTYLVWNMFTKNIVYIMLAWVSEETRNWLFICTPDR